MEQEAGKSPRAHYTIMEKAVMIILINMLSKFLNCSKSLKPQWTVHITSQLQWLKPISNSSEASCFHKKSAGFSSCCCLASALHPINQHHPQTAAEFNKAWNSTSSLTDGQILHPVLSEDRDAGIVLRGMLSRSAAGTQSPAAFGFLPVCP